MQIRQGGPGAPGRPKQIINPMVDLIARFLLASQKGRAEPRQGFQLIGYCAKATGSLQYDHKSKDVKHTIHNAPADYARVIVTMLCINPHSVSSQMAPSSRACLRHHAVLSGMFAGTIVPNHFEKESAGSVAALPNFLRPACAKNNAFLIARSN